MAQNNFCATCGNALPERAGFCPGCGQATTAQTQNPAPAQGAVPTFSYPGNEPHAEFVTHAPSATHEPPTIEVRNLHPNAVWLFFVSYLGTTSIVLLLTLIGIFFHWGFILATLGYFVANFIAAKVAYRYFNFEVTPTAFRKEYGIIHRQAATIPFERIQNINVSRNLLDRMLGLAHMDIETAGTGGSTQRSIIGGMLTASEGYIPGVAPEEARDLKELMFTRVQAVRGQPPHPGV